MILLSRLWVSVGVGAPTNQSNGHYVKARAGPNPGHALLRALDEGWITGAALDAHTVEPLPADSPLWTAPNTIVTPHAAAGVREAKAECVRTCWTTFTAT